jgi:hypothetical protein
MFVVAREGFLAVGKFDGKEPFHRKSAALDFAGN